MYHEKIDQRAAVRIAGGTAFLPAEHRSATVTARLWAALVVCGLPLFAIYLLAQLLYSDVKKMVRGARIFRSAMAEELSRGL
ncbi:MAG: hypothetical protein ABIO80_01140 [Sphingomicrobium sp.]